jgi:hypothetical protein
VRSLAHSESLLVGFFPRRGLATHKSAADAAIVGLRGKIANYLSALVLVLPIFAATAAAPPDWKATVTNAPRGDFPNPRPVVATYNFGWSDVVAAHAEIHFGKSDGQLQLDGSGETVGAVRALWKFDTKHHASADATTLQPIAMHQVDVERRKTVTTDLTFQRGKVERLRTDTRSKKKPATKTFRFQGDIFDMFSSLLYLRSQPLRDGDVYRVVVYPATNPYLVTLTVRNRVPLKIAAGDYQAIKLDVQVSKIGKKGQLEPHKKFHRASVWVSDDTDRLLLRIEASVFVGTVFAELQSVSFPDIKS